MRTRSTACFAPYTAIIITAAFSCLTASAWASGTAPSIERKWLTDVSGNDATLNAEINPHGLATTYRFHLYWLSTCHTPDPWDAECMHTDLWVDDPLPASSIAAGESLVSVGLILSGAEKQLYPETEFRYAVDATNEAGSVETPIRSFTTPSASAPPFSAPVNLAPPLLEGDPGVGSQLTCAGGSWQNDPTEYAYAWLRNASLIAGEEGRTYEVQSGDRGTDIACEVAAFNKGGFSKGAASNAVSVPAAPLPPVNIEAPVLSGSPTVGGTLECSAGVWDNAPTAFSYSWLRDGDVVSSGAEATDVLTPSDSGHSLSCEVIASKEGGAAYARSNSLNVLDGPPLSVEPAARADGGFIASTSPLIAQPLSPVSRPDQPRCRYRNAKRREQRGRHAKTAGLGARRCHRGWRS